MFRNMIQTRRHDWAQRPTVPGLFERTATTTTTTTRNECRIESTQIFMREDLQDILFEILSDTKLSTKPFSSALKCYENVPVPGSIERRQLTNRRAYLLRSPESLKAARRSYRDRQIKKQRAAAAEEEETAAAAEETPTADQETIQPRSLDFGTMSEQEEYDMEIPLSWDSRFNPGPVSLWKGETETKHHEVRQQIRFSVCVPNGKDAELYSVKLAKKKDGIIYSEPIIVRHYRDPALIARWAKVSAAVKNEDTNENLIRDMSVKAQTVNELDCPIKRIFYHFPDGLKASNRSSTTTKGSLLRTTLL
jgi:hypothetical protein